MGIGEIIVYAIIGAIIGYFMASDGQRKKVYREDYSSVNRGEYIHQKPNYQFNDGVSRNAFEPIITKVVGVTYEDRQIIINRMNIGEELSLLKEPNNIYDNNAVKVLRSNGEQVGYLNKNLAAEIQHYFNYSQPSLSAEVLDIIGNSSKGMNLGVVIKISPLIQAIIQPSVTKTSSDILREYLQVYKSYLKPGKKLPFPVQFYDTSTVFVWFINYFSHTDRDIVNGLYDEEERCKRYIALRSKNYKPLNIMSEGTTLSPDELDKIDFEAEYRFLKDIYNAISNLPNTKQG